MSLAGIGDFVILALSRDPAVTARMGDGGTMGMRAKTTLLFMFSNLAQYFWM